MQTAIPLKRDKVVTVYVLNYNGNSSPSVLPAKFHDDLICSRRVLIKDTYSMVAIVAAVGEVINKSLVGYWGSFCWQYTEPSVCSYYQSLLDQRDKESVPIFSLKYVLDRWGELHVRLTSPLPGHCPLSVKTNNGATPQKRKATVRVEKVPSKDNSIMVITIFLLPYNGMTRPSVHMCVTDEIPLTYVQLRLGDPYNQLLYLPILIRHSVKTALPEYTGEMCAVIPAKDVCERFQELLDEQLHCSVACDSKVLPTAFYPLYSINNCKFMYVRLTAPLSLTMKQQGPMSFDVPDASQLERESILESYDKKKRDRYLQTIKF